MLSVARPYWFVAVLGLTSVVQAQSHHGHITTVAHGGHGHSGSMHNGSGMTPGGIPPSSLDYGAGRYRGYAVGGYGLGYGFGYGYGYGFSYNYGYNSPLLYNNGGVPLLYPVLGGFGGGFGGAAPIGGGGGLMLPLPPQPIANANPVPVVTPAARRRNIARSKELVDMGDRAFRADNIKRAEDKYILAAKADPTSPAPHVHMAQVSLARGDYVAAADHLRDAVTVATEAGWILTTPDIQAVFAEPADFARQLARLETHLQANPTDRDGWFVLGAEYYLSGRSKQASDVFQRLTDRKADEALAVFMDASKTKLPAEN